MAIFSKKQMFILFTALFVSSSIFAQYGSSYNMNGYRNGMSQMGGLNQSSQTDKPKEIPTEVTVAKIMEKMTPAVSLDPLQAIAINNILVESIHSQGRILKMEVTEEEKIKNFQTLSENTDRKIMNMLSTAQKEQYALFKEDSKNPKKNKSKSKKQATEKQNPFTR